MKQRLFYPATERNRDPILSVLDTYLPENGHVLEVASGSGEHVVHFASQYPSITWQPSDLSAECLDSIAAWTDHMALDNILPPLPLDTTGQDHWPQNEYDALICINMVHITPWEATEGLMQKAGDLLKGDGFLYLYGPYRRNGGHTAPSNASFELWLKGKDPRFAVRDIAEVESEAQKNGLKLKNVYDMPANNFSLVFGKT